MTYKEYDNNFLDNSGTYCPHLGLGMRNNFHNFRDAQRQCENGFSRNLVNRTKHTVAEIGSGFSATSVWYVFSIGIDEYIYGVIEENYNIATYRYNIESGEYESIVTIGWEEWSRDIDAVLLSYIDQNRILVSLGSYEFTKVYLVDFRTMTASLELEAHDAATETGLSEIDQIYTEVIDGNIIACVCSTWAEEFGGEWGLGVYYKNFTTNSDWTLTIYRDAFYEDNYEYESWYVCSNRYLCNIIYRDAGLYPNDNPSLEVICFDIQTLTWKSSNVAYAYSFYPAQYYQYNIWMEPYYTVSINGNVGNGDMTDGNLYIAQTNWADYTSNYPLPGVTYDQEMHYFGCYDPVSNTLTTIHTEGWQEWNTDERGSIRIGVPSSPEYAYFWCTGAHTLRSKDYDTIYSETVPHWSATSPIIDGSMAFYGCDRFGNVFAIDLEGNTLVSWTLPVVDYDWIAIVAVGDCLIVEIDIDTAEDYIVRTFVLL